MAKGKRKAGGRVTPKGTRPAGFSDNPLGTCGCCKGKKRGRRACKTEA